MAVFVITWLLDLLFVLLLHGFICCIGNAAAWRIELGSRLLAGQNRTWVSDNSTFAFGFAPIPKSQDQFLLAIWYNNLPGDHTNVWSPVRNFPVGQEAVVELNDAGNLVLLNGRSAVVWSSNTSRESVEFAELADSGNLVLYNSTGYSVWQSFSYPSDTLLPNQPLTVSQELTTDGGNGGGSGGGYYSLKMLQRPNSLSLALTYNYYSPNSDPNLPQSYSNYSYWSSNEVSNATGDVIARLDQNGNFGVMYGSDPSGIVYVYQNDMKSGNRSPVLSRVTIEPNGNLRLYTWDEVNGSYQWVPNWAALSNPCMIAGLCGNGLCNLQGSKTNSSCSCLPGTSPAGEDGRCTSNSSGSDLLPGQCQDNNNNEKSSPSSSKIKIATMSQTTYYFSESSVILNYSDISSRSQCGDYCLSDCNCVASVYGLSEEKNYCWLLKSLVFGGLQDPSSTLYVKVSGDDFGGSRSPEGKDDESSSGDSKGRQEKVVVVPIVVCMTVLIGLLCMLLYYSVKRRRAREKLEGRYLAVPGAPRNFSYKDLQVATSNFTKFLGNGGFGTVYKGNLGDGAEVAVKKLERILPHGEKEFITEVNTIGSMHHMNLVRLCGFCSQGPHRLLVYEFMSNGSLDKWIFPSFNNRDRLLDWKTRFQIVLATAQGIAYFHEQCRNRIIHCDIKPENILLDEDFCPKISDFGLAKLMGRENSNVFTMVRGTRGYLAPEWVSNRPITVKADVYSFGMLLLEIIGGRRNVDMSLDAEDFFYPGWAYKEMMNGTPKKAADKRLDGKVEEGELTRVMNVAFWCIQEEVWVRPSMGEVVKMLEGSVEIKIPPMPQAVVELIDEGLDHVYKAMKREFNPPNNSSYSNSHITSQATCSYSSMSPR